MKYVEVIVKMHDEKKITSISLKYHCSLILRRIKVKSFNEEFLKHLVSILNRPCIDILSLCCLCAISLGDDQILWMLRNINVFNNNLDNEKNVFLSLTDNWALWPLIMVIKSKYFETKREIIKFLLKISTTTWIIVFQSADIVSTIFGIDSDIFTGEILDVLVDLMQNEEVQYDGEVFSPLVKYYLFFRESICELSRSMSIQFAYSPFNFANENVNLHFRSPETVIEIISAIEIIEKNRRDFMFGLKIQNDNWQHRQLAHKCLKIFLKHPCDNDFPLIIIILYFLLKSDSSFVQQMLTEININEQIKDKYQCFINLICQCLAIKNIDSTFLHYYKNIENEIPIEALSLFANELTNDFEKERIRILNEASKSSVIKSISFFDVDDCISAIEEARIETEESKKNNHKKWRVLYEELTIRGAPWFFLEEKYESQYNSLKRDSKLCGYYFIPLLLKPKRRKLVKKNELEIIKNKNRISRKKKKMFHSNPAKPKLKFEEPFIYKLDNEQDSVLYVTLLKSYKAKFKVTISDIIISFNNKRKIFPRSKISYVFIQNFIGSPIALEILLKNGKSLFVAFINETRRNLALRQLNLSPSTITPYQKRWINNQTSNFGYLIMINRFSYRSFNSPSQYPIMPWIELTNAHSNFKDKSQDSKGQRDFAKNCAEFGQSKISFLKRIKNDLDDISPPGHIMSWSMMPLSAVLNYLINILPVTNQESQLIQKSSFKFSSINYIMESVMYRINDYREIIPEFFSFPEVFTRSQLNGEYPIEYIYHMRKILESDDISKSLSQWIDLIFGSYQRCGDNVYHHYLYERSINECNNTDEKNLIRNFMLYRGTIPHRLFLETHPNKAHDEPDEEDNCLSGNLNMGNKISWIIVNKRILIADFESHNGLSMVSYDGVLLEYSINYINHKTEFKKQEKLLSFNGTKKYTSILSSKYDSVLVRKKRWALTIRNKNAIVSVLYNEKIIKNIHFFRRKIKCASIQPLFHVGIFGCEDGSILRFPLEDDGPIVAFSISEYEIRKLIITKSFGFIVTYFVKIVDSMKQNCIMVSTINGSFVRETIIPYEIIYLTTWCDTKGFDYIAFIDSNGNIRSSEAFYLNIQLESNEKFQDVVAFKFMKKLNSFVMITSRGEIIVKNQKN